MEKENWAGMADPELFVYFYNADMIIDWKSAIGLHVL